MSGYFKEKMVLGVWLERQVLVTSSGSKDIKEMVIGVEDYEE